MGEAFRVLHVCTGNLCRSPIAEHLMRQALNARLGADAEQFVVGSAGTHGRAGGPMEPYALEVLEALGVDGAAFRVRELEKRLVEEADLVLTATRQHRATVVDLDPGALTRTFTLAEFARLTARLDETPPGSTPGDRAREHVRAVAATRHPAARPRDDDLEDPYKGPRRGFQRCAASIEQWVRVPVEVWTAGTRT